MSLKALFRMFPNDATAEAWFVKTRWPNGIACHYCGSTNVQTGCQHKSMPFRCREKQCAKRFSVRTGTVMQSSKLGYQTWAIAAYLMATNLKGISSMKLHPRAGDHAEVRVASGAPAPQDAHGHRRCADGWPGRSG